MFGYFCDIGVFKNSYADVAGQFKNVMKGKQGRPP
jgi:hypothetical protein